jgi:hypothetical protein
MKKVAGIKRSIVEVISGYHRGSLPMPEGKEEGGQAKCEDVTV